MKKLGLIVNPIAGMGGAVGLKGTDGIDTLKRAKQLGAKPGSQARTITALHSLRKLIADIEIVTYPGEMGAEAVQQSGTRYRIIGKINPQQTNAEDTQRACQDLIKSDIDLLLFAGGDGTARDIYASISKSNPVTVLGIPTGVKIYSAVYACSPARAGELAARFLLDKIKHSQEAEVMDINEELLRQGRVTTNLFGYLSVPYDRNNMRGKKTGTLANELYSQQAIAADVVENMEKDCCYFIGPGTTTRAIMEKLGLANTLVGVDVVRNKQLLAQDCNERLLLTKMSSCSYTKIIITPIGGQGYLFGRGNQQISSEIIRKVDRQNIIIVATPEKISSLLGKPLLIDTGNQEVNHLLKGYYRIITGYREQVVYPVTY